MSPRIACWMVALLCLAGRRGGAESFSRDGHQVVCGTARFSVLSESVVRMEYSPSSRFMDAPTAVVLSREPMRCEFLCRMLDVRLVIETEELTLRYLPGAGAFSADNLDVSRQDGGEKQTWRPGARDNANLGGTITSFNSS